MSLFIVGESRSEVRETMVSCLPNHPSLLDDRDRYAIYIHITPHALSMIDRNSKLRDKSEGDIRLVFFEYANDPIIIFDKYGKIHETYDLKEYAVEVSDEQININRQTLIMTRNAAEFQCDILDASSTFERHVQLHLIKLQRKKYTEQENQTNKNQI